MLGALWEIQRTDEKRILSLCGCDDQNRIKRSAVALGKCGGFYISHLRFLNLLFFSAWNILPLDICKACSIICFKSLFKSHLPKETVPKITSTTPVLPTVFPALFSSIMCSQSAILPSYILLFIFNCSSPPTPNPQLKRWRHKDRDSALLLSAGSPKSRVDPGTQ